MPPPDDDVQADRYVMADEALRAAGFDWYEISNWARTPAGRCRHNELYWSDANWWGLGPGAHSHVGGVRWWNVKHPVRYTALVDAGRSPAAGRETLDDEARFTEQVMLGVRRREGLSMLDLPQPARGVRAAAGDLGAGRPAALRGRPARAHPARPADGRRGGQGAAHRGLSVPRLPLRPGERNASRSRMRTCRVVRPCSAARRARCRPSSR